MKDSWFSNYCSILKSRHTLQNKTKNNTNLLYIIFIFQYYACYIAM